MRLFLLLASIVLAGCRSTPEPSSPRPVQEEEKPTPATFTFEFSNFRAGDPDVEPTPRLPEVYVKIAKLDPVEGLVEWSAIHKQGSILGFREEEGNLSSTHLVFSPKRGKRVRVDFDTGTKILRIDVDKMEPYEYRRCLILDQPLAECPGPLRRHSFRRVNRVVYRAASGKELSESISSPMTRDDLRCPSHGGVDLPTWTPEQVREARLQAGTLLFSGAERTWNSMNPKTRRESQEKYRKLLEKYADLDLVREHRPRIEERAKAQLEE